MVCLKIIKIKGNYYDMGVSYGSQCKKNIHSLLRQLNFSLRLPNFMSPFLPDMLYKIKNAKKGFITQFTDYTDTLEKNYPEVQDLFEGISHGSKKSFEEIVFLNNMTDFIFKCSGWSACGNATSSGQPLLGMNSDEEKSMLNHEIVLQVETNKEYNFIGTTIAGTWIFGSGMNEKGLAFALPLLLFMKEAKRNFKSMPTVCLMQAFSKCKTISEVLDLYKDLPISHTPISIHLADKEQITRIEYSRNNRDIAFSENGVFSNCNRPSSTVIKDEDITLQMSKKATYNAVERSSRMTELLKKSYGKINTDQMMSIARDHGEGKTSGKGICQHSRSPFGFITITSLIASPSDLRLWVAHGQPCKNEYKEFQFN